MITTTQFEELYIDEDNEVDLPGKDCVYVGDEIVEHKHTYQEEVYKVGDQFFKVISTWSNSGYWSDIETYPKVIVEVKPVVKTITVYE